MTEDLLYDVSGMPGMKLLTPHKDDRAVIMSDVSTTQFLERIYDAFGKYSGSELASMICHEEHWITSRNGLRFFDPGHEIMSDQLMFEYCA